jgi:hypothetical protein
MGLYHSAAMRRPWRIWNSLTLPAKILWLLIAFAFASIPFVAAVGPLLVSHG